MNLLRLLFSNSNLSPLSRTVRFGLLVSALPIVRLVGAVGDVTQTVIAGGNVTFSVTADGTPSPTFQWKKNGVDISGQTNNTLTLNSVTSADAATYTAIATNSAGTAVSNNATLVVSSSAIAPTITTQPASQTVVSGASATFSVAATGLPAPTYQWRQNGFNISGANATSLTLPATSSSDAATYDVVVTNSAGTAISNGATLTVTQASTAIAPVITSQPSAATVAEGATATFSVAASGSPAPVYQWYKNWAAISGATSATLTISNVTKSDEGTYMATATNDAGSVTSWAQPLTVTTAAASVAPTITTQPVSQSVNSGANVSFTVAASGTPTPTYQWFKDGYAISGATTATLTLNNVAGSDTGTYYAVATNSAGSATTDNATLNVATPAIAPTITTQPVSESVAAGANVTLSIAATGSPAPTYQWFKGTLALAGATNATLTLTNVSTSDAGIYCAAAMNSGGTVLSNDATLTVTTVTAPGGNTAPAFTLQPVSQTVIAKSTVTFTASASGSPTPTYQWKLNGANITGATSATLKIANVNKGDSGTYTVTATNSAGSATSSAATLTVKNR